MIKPLTSLRFFFALIVFLSHLEWVPAIDASFTGLYENVFSQGYLGVSFFFILSGFILTHNYKTRLLQKEISFRQFWINRIARIYPLHLITLIFSLIFFLPDLFREPYFWLKNFASHLFLVQSFVPSEKVYFGFNAVSWSISNELFYYFIFPVLLYVLYKVPKSIYLFFLFFIFIAISINFTPKTFHIFIFSVNPLIRIADFILGIILYKFFELKIFSGNLRRRHLATFLEVCAISLFLLFFLFHQRVPIAYRFAIYYWIPMAALIYVFAHSGGFFSRILSTRILIVLGEISFSFYMSHGLLMRSIKAVERRIDYSPNIYLLLIIIFFITLIVSFISYHFLELPANRRIRHWLRKKQKEEPDLVLE